MAAPAKRDLDELAHHPDYNVKVQIERRESDAEAQYRRRKDLLTHVAVLIALGIVVFAALLVLFVPGFDPESKSWARSALSAFAVGAIGFLAGKKQSD